jgi:hypothetical protein
MKELDIYRALTHASGIWPAVWLANAFIGPTRQVNLLIAGNIGKVPDDWFDVMQVLLQLVEKGDAEGAQTHLLAHFKRVDEGINEQLAILFPR